VNQRWRDRGASYRPAGEVIAPSQFEVALLESDATARAFVERHHYSGTYPAARVRVALYRGAQLAGVAVVSHPCSDRVLTSVFPGPALEAIELGRFVLLDDVAGNGETWFLARCFALLRARGIRGVVSFSDPFPRVTAAGVRVFPGHIGTIYQAHNARYLGRGTARSLRVLPDGQVLSARTLQKLRAGEKGWHYAAALLERHGATTMPADLQDRERRGAWLREQLPRVTRLARHPGNHRYAWPLDRRRSVALAAHPYPKALDLRAA
jgi:hypothetical protein